MSDDAFSVYSAAACAQLPARCADILTIGANPAVEIYLAGLFEQFEWTISCVPGFRGAREFLEDADAAVAVCEELLTDGCWRDVALYMKSLPNRPSLVVIGDDWNLLGEVFEEGGFDALTRPLLDSEVLWSIASAWHEWMKMRETGGGGARCSGA